MIAVRHRKRPRQVSSPVPRPLEVSPRAGFLAETLEQAERMLLDARAENALELLEPLVEKHRGYAPLYGLLGRAYLEAGDGFAAAIALERAADLSPDVVLRLRLAGTYESLGFLALSLREYRCVLRSKVRVPGVEALPTHVEKLDEAVAEIARHLELPVQRTEEGLLYLERAALARYRDDRREAISLSRKAIARLGDWPPAHVGLAADLYLDGQPDEAIAALQRVLARYPDDLDALCTAIHCLVWSNRLDEARPLWSRLEHVEPENPHYRMKLAHAAADLDRDADVYRLLQPLARKRSGKGLTPRAEELLAVAEANLGRRDAALRRMRRLRERFPYLNDLIAALEAGKPGLGIAQRFSYVHHYTLLPLQVHDQLFDLMAMRDKMSPRRFRQQLDDLVKRYPQVVLLAEKMIWEMDLVSNGIVLLKAIGTPAARAALKRFAFSQAGADIDRMTALYVLVDLGELPAGQPVRAWLRGEWREFTLQAIVTTEPSRPPYSAEVMALLDRAIKFMKEGDNSQAERLFLEVLKAEPRAIEAYNNLGVVYEHCGDYARARDMHRRALDINPDYVYSRGNLAIYLLRDGDVDGAERLVQPLANRERMTSIELAFLCYVQAECLIAREAFTDALVVLDRALTVMPDYEPAKNLLEWLETKQEGEAKFGSFRDRILQHRAAARRRLQERIPHLDPTLREVLDGFSRQVLTGVGRAVMPHGGWSGMKKADLIEELAHHLSDPDDIEFAIITLEDEELEALRDVLKKGGAMPWQEFDAKYGNDLDESGYWNYHVPETVMGRLRMRALLAEATVDGTRYVCVPREVRHLLMQKLGVNA